MQKKKCKINRVGALKGRWRVDCKKKCKIKRVGALRCRLQKKSGKLTCWGIKGRVEGGLQKKVQN